jgi:hypothetical protein
MQVAAITRSGGRGKFANNSRGARTRSQVPSGSNSLLRPGILLILIACDGRFLRAILDAAPAHGRPGHDSPDTWFRRAHDKLSDSAGPRRGWSPRWGLSL